MLAALSTIQTFSVLPSLRGALYITWPISGNPAGWNRSPTMGSSVAVNTSGDSPFKTSAGVSFFG